MAETEMRDGMLTERTDLYGGGVSVAITPFPDYLTFTLTVRKERELGSDRWRSAAYSTPMTRLGTVEDVTAYGRALLLLAEIGAGLDAEFAE